MSKLYNSHVPLNGLSKFLLGAGSGLAAILNPARGDMVAAMGEATAIQPVLTNIRFLERLNTSPDNRPPVKYIDDLDLLYVMQRYRETHDFNHVALEMPTNMLGEVTVKYFEAIQLGLPMTILGSIFGGMRLLPKHHHQLITRNIPWIFEQAPNCRLFISFDWENHFDVPIKELQKKLNVVSIQDYFKQ